MSVHANATKTTRFVSAPGPTANIIGAVPYVSELLKTTNSFAHWDGRWCLVDITSSFAVLSAPGQCLPLFATTPIRTLLDPKKPALSTDITFTAFLELQPKSPL